MGCQSCKKKKGELYVNNDAMVTESNDIGFKAFNIVLRIIMLGIGLSLSPLILVFIWYMLFKIIILDDGDVNLMPSMVLLGKKLGIGRPKKSEEKYPDDYEDLDSNNPDDYEIDEKIDKVEL